MEPSELWLTYPLHIDVDRLVGGIPKHPEIIRRWQEARWPNKDSALAPGDPQNPEEAAVATLAALGDQAMSDEEVAGVWTGFVTTDTGEFAIESRQIKAMLKESANILRTMLPVRGKIIPLRAKLAERVFVQPHPMIGLGVKEPSGTIERPVHVMTAQGPRTALKRTDYVDDVSIDCVLKVLNDGLISYDMLATILEHASENGLGTDRSQGQGIFRYSFPKP